MRRLLPAVFSLCLLTAAAALAAELPDFSADMEARKREKSDAIPAAEIVGFDLLIGEF